MATAVKARIPVADIGLTILSDPQDAVLDIIFVHGLQGHPQDTWTYKPKPAQSPQSWNLSPSKAAKGTKGRTLGIFPKFSKRKNLEPRTLGAGVDQENDTREIGGQGTDVFWPGDLLKEDIPKARIMTFGYNTKVTQGYQAAHQGNIFSHARDLLYGLDQKRRKVVDRDLVFIAHSLGGILVKEVLRRSQTDPDTKMQKIFFSTTGVFFFGTPHRGSKDWASFGEGVAGVAGRLLGIDTNHLVIHALLPSGPELELCRESFTTQWVARGDSLVVRTFQESKGVTGIRWGALNQLIVPPDSSSLDHPNQRARTIDEDHIGMVKFKGRNDEPYEMVKADIEELVENSQTAKETINVQDNMTKEDQECILHLRVTDPRHDKTRIEDTKGGLLEDSYRWILGNSNFQRWRDDQQTGLLWIKGDPGKGKTMLLCGIINELNKSMAKTNLLSYFFCQATDSRINSATAVLRGLLFLVVTQQPLLVSHIRRVYDQTGKALFEDANAWVAISEIFTDILQDPGLNSTYLFIDALDECTHDLEKLLAFIVQKSSLSSRVKWILTSRNHANIEQRLRLDNSGTRLSLELRENAAQVSHAVDAYIDYRILELHQIQHDQSLQSLVRGKMQQKANGTFLWVSLVMKELKDVLAWEVLQVLEGVPTELTDVYRRMMEHIKQLKRRNPEICRQILSTVVATYRPLHLQELYVLADLPDQGLDIEETTATMVKMCGSFLTVREDHVYVIHQSARDFLSDEAGSSVLPFGTGEVHGHILSRSLQVMSRTLQRDIYRLDAPGYPIEQVQQPEPDPLAASRYSCIYWVDHLCDWSSSSVAHDKEILQGGGVVEGFLREKYVYWLEALSLCKSMSKGIVSIAKLEALTNETVVASSLIEVIRDAHIFIMYHKSAIESSPLQVYASALLFSPIHSLIRILFKEEEPNGITIKPVMQDKWSSCLSTLEGHSSYVYSVAFFHDSTQLASASHDGTVKIWNASSGECLSTLKGHRSRVNSVTISNKSTRLASASSDNTVKIWDTSSGECLSTLVGHRSPVWSVAFSHDSTRLASASYDSTVKVWDASSSKCLSTLKGHSRDVWSVAFSHDSTRLASASGDSTVKVWDASSGECLSTLVGHRSPVWSVAFSHDSTRLASASYDSTVKVWDASSSECLSTLTGHSNWVWSVAFSHDSTRLASGSYDRTIKIWDASSGECLSTLKDHSEHVFSVAFSHDSTRLASASMDSTVKVWDTSSGECLSILEGHSGPIYSVLFSHDSTRLASASRDSTVKIWDTSSGKCLSTLEDHRGSVALVAFSHDSTRLASASVDQTVKIWNTSNGECLSTLEGHSRSVNSVAFSHNSTRLASASSDKTVKIWDTSSGECLSTFEGHSHVVNSVAFSHDSTRLASGSYDRTVKVWGVSSGECILTLEGHSGPVFSVAFSHNSSRLASASDDSRPESVTRDRTVNVWDASSGQYLSTLKAVSGLSSISFDINRLCQQHDIGVININALSSSGLFSANSEARSPNYQGLALSADGTWLTYNSENFLWLPSEYRPYCLAVSGNRGNVIAIGVKTGRVWMCKVSYSTF
ncbi:WD40 repeat-like protein [Zopfia rhizophila CBS 207.26]|uniref:Mitochondrial division protein 1 n=1 Tax=Zopfia rhizophila CBS 207.26 TaxID=1314779 RepID=A0A6A6DJL8_9PEZI|nr:WD40 repeat-like protein [Zopfia rhizophila CBS 207.26]